MEESLQWFFELLDMTSGPARKIQGALEGVNRAVKQSKTLFGGWETQQQHSARVLENNRRAVEGYERSWTSFLSVAKIGAGVLAGLGAAGLGLGYAGAQWVLETAQFRENTLTGLQSILGTRRQAQSVFAEIQRVAMLTPFSSGDVTRDYSQLITSGFSARQASNVYAGGADIGSSLGSEKMQGFLAAAQRVQAMGRANQEVINSLALSGVGLSGQGGLYQQLAHRLNIGGSGASQVAAVRAAISHGRVDSATTLNAALDTISARYNHGGRVGARSRAGSDTLTGVLSNFQDAPTALLTSMNLENNPGLKAFKDTLKAITGLFDSSTSEGRRLTGTLNTLLGAFNEIFGPAAANNGQGVRDTFNGIMDVVDMLIPLGKSLWNDVLKPLGSGLFQGLGSVLGPVFRLIQGFLGDPKHHKGMGDLATGFNRLGLLLGRVGGAVVVVAGVFGGALVTGALRAVQVFGDLYVQFENFLEFFGGKNDLGKRFMLFGQNIVDGLWNGITSRWAAFLAQFDALVQLLPDTVKHALGIASPSRVFMQLGAYTAQGFQRGIEGGMGGVGDAIDAMARPRLGPGRAAAVAGGITIPISVEVNVAPGDDARETGRRAGEGAGAELREQFEAILHELGLV